MALEQQLRALPADPQTAGGGEERERRERYRYWAGCGLLKHQRPLPVATSSKQGHTCSYKATFPDPPEIVPQVGTNMQI